MLFRSLSGNAAAALNGLPGVSFINQTDSISSALRTYRRAATCSTAVFYGLILAFLAIRYGLRRALRIFISEDSCSARATMNIFSFNNLADMEI